MTDNEKILYEIAIKDISDFYRKSNRFELSLLRVVYNQNEARIVNPKTDAGLVYYTVRNLKSLDLDTKTAAKIMVKALNKVRFGISLG